MTVEAHGWRCLVNDDFAAMGVEIYLASHGLWAIEIASSGMITQAVGEGKTGPAPMRMNVHAAEALRDGLDVFLGKKPNDFEARYEEARDALEVERMRVNALLLDQPRRSRPA